MSISVLTVKEKQSCVFACACVFVCICMFSQLREFNQVNGGDVNLQLSEFSIDSSLQVSTGHRSCDI